MYKLIILYLLKIKYSSWTFNDCNWTISELIPQECRECYSYKKQLLELFRLVIFKILTCKLTSTICLTCKLSRCAPVWGALCAHVPAVKRLKCGSIIIQLNMTKFGYITSQCILGVYISIFCSPIQNTLIYRHRL